MVYKQQFMLLAWFLTSCLVNSLPQIAAEQCQSSKDTHPVLLEDSTLKLDDLKYALNIIPKHGLHQTKDKPVQKSHLQKRVMYSKRIHVNLFYTCRVIGSQHRDFDWTVIWQSFRGQENFHYVAGDNIGSFPHQQRDGDEWPFTFVGSWLGSRHCIWFNGACCTYQYTGWFGGVVGPASIEITFVDHDVSGRYIPGIHESCSRRVHRSDGTEEIVTRQSRCVFNSAAVTFP